MEYVGNKFCKHLENHCGLDQNVIILERKLEELNGIKEDEESIKISELQPRKKLKKEVDVWFRNVERINGEILDLLNQVREANFVSRGSLGAEVSTKTKEVEELIEKGKSFNGLVIDEPRWIGQALSTTTLFGEVPKKVMKEIWEHLMDDDVSKIGVWGMGGVGKTTIMKLINNQVLKETEKFNIVIWITVSKEMNIAGLQDGITSALGEESLSKVKDETRRAGVLYEMLAQRGKYVLILDDVWDTFSLEEVGIPEPSNGSKIVITTRSSNVCHYFGAQEVRLHTLPGQDAWDLFLQKVGGDVLDHPRLLPIVESVAEECDGLPLAIVTIASSMKGVRNIQEWRNALNELRRCAVQSVSGSNEKIFQRLQFSYDRLEDEKVKYCFLYLSLYPEDKEVEKVELIEKWIEEGFVEEMDSMQEEIDKGHTIMNKLINNCLFVTSRNGGFVSLHDLMRDMALRIPSVRPRFLVKAGMQLKQIPAVQEWTEDLEKVSFMENWGLGIPSNMSPPKCGMLTTLLLGSCYIRSISESFFEHMRGLKILDLSFNDIESVPTSIVNLKDLTILLLNNCYNLERLPSFSNLQALKKLNLDNTKIKDVPHGLERLVNLQHLNLRYTDITKVADGLLAKLTSLRSLQIMSFDRNRFPSVNGEEIGGLKKLKHFEGRFCELGELNHYVQAVCAPTIRLTQYVICVGNDLEYVNDDELDLRKLINIQYVYIPRDGVKILSDINGLRIECCSADLLYEEETFCSCLKPVPPNDIFSSLSYIEVFEIKNIKKLFSFNWMMQNLRHLRELYVGQCDEMEEIIASESDAEEEGMGTIQFALPRLKTLVLGDLPILKSICSANRVMVCDSIEKIVIRRCPGLRRMPLYLPLRDDGLPSHPPPLQNIAMDGNGWEMMEWDHPNAKSLLEPFSYRL